MSYHLKKRSFHLIHHKVLSITALTAFTPLDFVPYTYTHLPPNSNRLKSRPEREGGAVKPMAAKLKVLQITTVDDVLHLLCVKTYEELGALQSELQKGINLAAEENE